MKKIDSVLKEVLRNIEPPKEDLDFIRIFLKKFLKDLEKKIKVSKVNAEVFVGGSFAKKTMIKKDYYDVDVFVRFDGKYKEKDISNMTKKLLEGFKNVALVHGSRDYFRVKANGDFLVEVIPVMKVKNPSESENITDLSYSHVKYIKKIKSKKIIEDMKLAKAFCYASKCYGAESYIRGFSGYSLELLVHYYKGFVPFLKAVSKMKEKAVIDIEKHYKNKQNVLMDVNASKLHSPIILIDPTFKQRNALAALSEETFEKFKKACVEFLKSPSVKSFEIKKTDLEKIKKDADKNKYEFILIEVKTDRQEGDIAGSKLLKFYNHLDEEIKRYFYVKDKGFNYNGKQSARYFFVVKSKEEILIEGPDLKDEKNRKAFKLKHKSYFTKKRKIYSKEKVDFSLKEFLRKWKDKNKRKIKEMYIKNLEIIEHV